MEKMSTKYDDVLFGALFIGLGQIVLCFAVPKFYVLLSQEVAYPGTGLSINDFPIQMMLPFMQWLFDTVGAFGMSVPLVAMGVGIIGFGWQEYLKDKLD
jgi:hypothetical protein